MPLLLSRHMLRWGSRTGLLASGNLRKVAAAASSTSAASQKDRPRQKQLGTHDARKAPRKRQRVPRLANGMRIAVEGCCHGELDAIYATLQQLEKQQNTKIDLLICCGDFQAVRNYGDLECVSIPDKFKQLGTFHKYYSGEVKAPYPTLFIGGNHEASNYLWELYYGGWAAPNIYYLGHAGVVSFGGVRIGGLSGTYIPHNFRKGHFEGPPYDSRSLKSAYHLRDLEVFRMLQLRQPLDVMLTHDWPDGIAYHGNFRQLFQQKKHLRAEIERGELGSKPGMELMAQLRPEYWFAAHYHVKFPALVRHPASATDALAQQFTNFLALDKCLPGRKFLQVIDFPDARGPLELSYDPEWLSILHSTHDLLSLHVRAKQLPANGTRRVELPVESSRAVQMALERAGSRRIPANFTRTAPPHAAGQKGGRSAMPRAEHRNPQTEAFLESLGLAYNLDHAAASRPGVVEQNPEEIDLGDLDAEEANPEEIDIDAEEANPEEIDLDAEPEVEVATRV